MDEVRLINANALCQHIQDRKTRCQVLDVINEAPTVDPESLPPYWRKTAEDPTTREEIEK